MTNINVLIKSKSDPITTDEVNNKEIIPFKCYLREAASETEKTNVQILATDEDGKNYEINLTANLFEMMAGAVKGAVERFGA